MKKEKGFTLIELLAVIVILAIILLIATPIILNIIDDVRKGAFKSSVHGYLKSAEYKHLETMLDGSGQEKIFTYIDGELQGDEDLDYGGESPKNGTIHITKDGKVAIAIHNGKWCAMKSYDNSKITIDDKELEDCKLDNLPDIVVPGFDNEKGVNKPVLSSGMKPIIYNETTGEWDEVSENNPNWYDYNAKKWANVRTADGSMWVWIPRYAYKITNGYHSSETGEIEVRFLQGASNKTVDGTKVSTTPTYNGNIQTNYVSHPAFQFNGEELGFWVAKFEPTAAEGVVTITGSCNALDNVDSKIVKIVPNATSWRCINIKNAFNASLSMKEKTEIYGWSETEVDTHMMKNTEWGAIAYLSKSIYGAHTEEIWNNAYNQYKTGCSGNGINAANEGICIAYNDISNNGVKASTTHNVYGIYDMSGGAWERVMGNYNNLGGSSGFTNAEVEAIDDKYIDRYNTSTENMLNGIGMDYDISIYGDAVYETSYNAARNNGSSWEGNGLGSWYGDYSYLPYHTSIPWFLRDSDFNYDSGAGIFSFNAASGLALVHSSFRPALFVK